MDRKVLRNLSYGLYIISSKYEDVTSGCVVNAVTQITSENPIISISVNKNNYTNEIIKKSKRVAVSILTTNVNKEVISKFGFYSSKDVNKFEEVKYDIVNDLPVVIEGACSYIIGDVIDVVDVETHDIFLVRVTDAKKLNEDIVLTYEYYQNNMKGSSPKNAPTYIEKEVENTDSLKYRCIICGHIYDDGVEETKFEDLPDDWVCPVCGVTKDKFEKIN